VGLSRVAQHYSFELLAGARERLGRLLVQALGEKTKVQTDPSIAYGGEDDWLAREGDRLPDNDQLILLFNFGSTPEVENHGAIARGVRQHVGVQAELMVLLDDSGFIHKLRGQPSAQRRLEERLQAWQAVLASAGVEPIRITLDAADEQAAARALEKAMLRTANPA
jgi:hypothetical protein